jgi:hypothetical protein
MKKKQVEKFCIGHEKNLPIEDFYYIPSVNGYGSYCKECDKKKKREWYKQNKARIDAKRKKWQEDNYALHLEHQTKYNKSEKGLAAKKRHLERLKAKRESAQQ